MRLFLSATLLLLTLSASAQLKYDANWVFGDNIHLEFTNGTIQLNNARCLNVESSVTISDPISGELIFYLSDTNRNEIYSTSIFGPDHQAISTDANIIHCNTCTNGAIILPNSSSSIFTIFHIGLESNCIHTTNTCRKIYMTQVYLDEFGKVQIRYKNRKVIEEVVGERLTAVKHANGIDWWIYSHENSNSCTDVFNKFLFKEDTIVSIDTQQIGLALCDSSSKLGEITISLDGKKMALAVRDQNAINILDINRYTGELSNSVILLSGIYGPYGLEFSPDGNNLYYTKVNGPSFLFVIDLTNGNRETLKAAPFINIFGQLQITPDQRIIMTSLFNDTLFAINDPNSQYTENNFTMQSIPLSQGMESTLSLPNNLNYDLGPLPVFTSTAGGDTVQCKSGSGITLGVPAVPNILYQWSPSNSLSSTSIAQPLATPSVDTWYYLTATDTTMVDAVSIDSVLVQVVNCVGIEELGNNSIHIYPNPATNQLNISLPDNAATAQLALYSLLGERLLNTPIHDKTPIDISPLPRGLYVYRIQYQNKYYNGKLVVE